MADHAKSKDKQPGRSIIKILRGPRDSFLPINIVDCAELHRQILSRIRDGYYEQSDILTEIASHIEPICRNR